jgi:hypothetical protein
MSMQVQPFTPELVPAVKAFNQRLATGGAGWRFPEDPVPNWLARSGGSAAFQEYLLLIDREQVRGAYVLKHQEVSFRGQLMSVGCQYGPISEGLIDKAHALVPTFLLRDALRRKPLLFGIGLGGDNTPMARLFRAVGFRLTVLPFHFKVVHGSRFLREIEYLRSSWFRRCLLDLAAATGAGWLGQRLVERTLSRRPRHGWPVVVEVVEQFGEWADDIWQECATAYSFVAVRDRPVLNRIYPPGRPGFLRLKMTAEGVPIGYAVLRDAPSPGHARVFGRLRTGVIMDCLARPDMADAVIHGATATLEQRGVDFIFSNQSHPAWCRALRHTGFLKGPSTFVLATSPPLTKLLATIDPGLHAVHLNRGDGEFPWGTSLRVGGQSDWTL